MAAFSLNVLAPTASRTSGFTLAPTRAATASLVDPTSTFARSSSQRHLAPRLPRSQRAHRSSSASRIVCKVSEGDAAPDFSLQDQRGRPVSLSKLRGKNVVLYFYPADDTPGCTKQACSFRDSFEEFKQLGAEVLGISGDSVESHAQFAEKYNLPYRLLADEGNQVRKEWGVPTDLLGFLPGRQTYVIDRNGIVQLVFNNQFQPEKHIQETVALLQDLKEEQKPAFQFPKLF